MALLFVAVASTASAQTRRPAPRVTAPPVLVAPPTQIQFVPAIDVQSVSKLVWSTLAAVDHGNITGNYSVLRDLGAPGFQANNTAATLAGVFQTVRTQRIDLSNTLLLAPTFDFAPTIVQGGLLRARGRFAMRPVAIGFDLLYASVGGRWQLFGVAVVPLPIAAAQPPRGR